MVGEIGKKCTGCNVCLAVCEKNAILLNKNSDGFWYPIIYDDKCVKCNKCWKSCPIVEKKENIEYNAVVTYVAKNKNENVRFKSSSGGIFHALAMKILNNNGYVVGAALNADMHSVQHIIINDFNMLEKIQGSKYVQSFISAEVYLKVVEFVKGGKDVLFSGTPCQISAIKKILLRDYKNFYTVDIVCHGVPSPLAWERYVDEMEKLKKDNLVNVNFRSKIHGWKKYEMNLDFVNTSYSQWFNKNCYGKSFINSIFLRECCYDCRFKGFPRVGDISLGDFWGIEEKYDDDKGTSLVIANTKKGKVLLTEIRNEICFDEISITKAYPGNYALLVSSKRFESREEAFEMLKKDNSSFSSVVNKVTHVPLIKKVFNKIKR